MIKAVIFDCFGVLASDEWPMFRDQFFSAAQARKDIEAVRDKIDRGMLPRTEFIERIVQHTGMTPQEIDKRLHANRPNMQLLEYVATLKLTYKIGMLSNVSSDRTPEIFGAYHTLFDRIVLSCDIGVAKPGKQAYNKAAEQLGVQASECVFVDDRSENIVAAELAGMTGLHFSDTKQCIKDLQELLHED